MGPFTSDLFVGKHATVHIIFFSRNKSLIISLGAPVVIVMKPKMSLFDGFDLQ